MNYNNLGGVLTYRIEKSIGTHGQTVGADGIGDFCILLFGSVEFAETKARQIITQLKTNKKLSSVIFVPNDPFGSYNGNPITCIDLNDNIS